MAKVKTIELDSRIRRISDNSTIDIIFEYFYNGEVIRYQFIEGVAVADLESGELNPVIDAIERNFLIPLYPLTDMAFILIGEILASQRDYFNEACVFMRTNRINSSPETLVTEKFIGLALFP